MIFAHEQSVVFETGKGLVIFNSCSHGGIVNIVREVQMALGGQKVYAVVGGFHMMKLSGMDTLAIPEEEVVETAQELKGLGVEEIYTGHCTGNIAFGILKKELGEMVTCTWNRGNGDILNERKSQDLSRVMS